ncbi:uncharacterized protein [Henckelia pumila]|uniref:uncharacterized protein n=1 Tax=Henckelia pumila TaxID=405737 RepID=UPI003C6E41CE
MKNSSQIPQQQCPLTLEGAMAYEMEHGSLFNNPNLDLKKIRRIISNKISAQRSRIKRGIYTRDLETMVKDLEVVVCILNSQLEIYKNKNKLLQLQNDSLRPQLEKRSDESKCLEVDIEEKRAGIKMLKMELEKEAQKNKQLASDFKEKKIPYFGFEPHTVAPYPNNIFYQNRLQNLVKNPRPSHIVKMEPDFAIEQSNTEIKPAKQVEKTIQDYEDADQYINFDALSSVGSEGEN